MPRNKPSRRERSSAVPQWALDVLERYIDRFVRQGRLVRISINGIRLLPGRVRLLKAVHNLDALKKGIPYDKKHPRIKEAELDRRFAQSEIDSGFPILYEQSIISMWALLESFVKHFLSQWIQQIPRLKNIDSITNISIKLGEYEALEEAERCLWIIDALDQNKSGRLKSGVNRFETLLELFELGGSVDEATRKCLFELSKVRNAIVHKGGVADRQFVDACPWYGIKVGEKIVMNHEKWFEYSSACDKYLAEILGRVILFFEKQSRKSRKTANRAGNKGRLPVTKR